MRTRYRNGEPISLGNCDDCQVVMINGILCHERGCPSAWKDTTVACFECGCDFYRTDKYQRCCPDCEEFSGEGQAEDSGQED